MAIINTKLIKYATQARFDIDIAKVPAVIDSKSIIFIEDTGRIYAHGKYFGGDWEYLTNKPITFTPSAHTLGSHSDVALTTLDTNNILKWSGSKWVNNTLAQAGIATPADISTAIDGIEIGGRNLAEYGNWLISNGVAVGNHTFTLSASTGSSSIRQRGGSLKLEPNTNYVFSFRVRKLSGNFNKIGGHISPNFINNSPTYIDGSDVGYNYSSPLIHEPLNDGEWHKVVAHLKTTATINDTGLLYIQPNRSTYEAVSVEIKDLMFEKGNKATDWSPAPEDQVTDWNVTDVNSFAFLKNKPTKLTLTGAVTGNTTLSSGELSLNTSLTAHNHTWTQITGTIPTWNQSTTGNAATASAVSTSAENSDATSRYILFADNASGNQALKTDTGLKYVSSTNTISANFAGNLTGLASLNLPLTGGTLSGSLIINGSVPSLSLIRTSSYNVNILFEAVEGKVYAGKGKGSDFVIGSGPDLGSSPNQWMKVNSSGVTAPTFIGALTGLASLNLPLTGGTLSGTLGVNLATSSTYNFAFQALAPTLSANQQLVFQLGKSSSTNNRVSWVYNHIADGSVSNFMSFAFYGSSKPQLKMEASGASTFSGNVTAPTFIGALTGDASSATKVNNQLTLKFDTGTTENTNLYTYDGSAAKTIDIKAGSNVSFTKTGSTITINSTDTDTTYTTSTLAQLNAGAHTVSQLHTAKLLNDWLNPKLALKATPADITTAINSIEIGGRNLLLNTKRVLSGSNSQVGTYYLTESIIEGEECVFSCTLESLGSNTKDSLNLYNSGSAVNMKTYTYDNSVRKQRVFIKFNWRIGTSSNTHINLFSAPYGNSSDLLISDVVLVRAKQILTDWTPAPEDQVSDWNVTDATLFSFIKNKPTQLSQFTDNIGVGSHIANKANPHAVTTAQIGAVDLTTNQNIGGNKSFNNYLQINGSTIIDGNTLNIFISGNRGKIMYGENTTADRKVAFGSGWGTVDDFAVFTKTSGSFSASTQRFTVKMDGNVGIGTTNPLYKLDVSGTGRFTDNVTAPTFIGALSGNASSATTAGSTADWAGNTYVNSNITNEQYLMTSTNGTDWRRTLASRYVDTTSAQSIGGVKSFSSQVKIENLEVRGGDNVLPNLGFLNSKVYLSNNGSLYGMQIGVLGVGSGYIQQGRTDGTATAYSLLLNPNGGNVGIGTTSPAYKLDVTGTGRFTDNVTAPKIFINKYGNTASGISWYNSTYTAWQDYMANSSTTGNGVNANITAPSGTLVTAWGKRSFIENATGFGWTFESGTNSSTTPSVVAEIRSSDGAARFGGSVTATSFLGKATSAGDADTVGGLAVNPAANTSANRLVRTNASGYIQSAYINTTSGLATGTLNRVYVSQDSYLRYLTPADFISNLGLATESYVNNIEIGGRNLLIGSKDTWTTVNAYASGAYIDLFFKATILEEGQEYIFSWETELLSGTPSTSNQVTIGSGTTTYQRDIMWTGRKIIGKQFRVFTATGVGTHKSFAIRWYNANSAFSFRYRKLKLEKGNKPSADWTSAPEDQVSDWNVTDINSFAFLKNKPTTFTTLGLTDNAGSATQPVYFSGGKPVATTYSLGKSVPSNAVFTDTNTYVTQNVTTISEYKPFLLGYNTATISGNFANITSSSFYANTLRVQPSTGNIITSGTVTASKMFKSSDRSLKEKIGKINLSNIDKINLIEFNWKSDNKKDYGVIAQDLEVYYPELVNTDDNGMKTVNYESLYAVKIARLEERIKELEDKLWKN